MQLISAALGAEWAAWLATTVGVTPSCEPAAEPWKYRPSLASYWVVTVDPFARSSKPTVTVESARATPASSAGDRQTPATSTISNRFIRDPLIT